MSNLLTVTVLIPARNEEADIERCLSAVLAQDYPADRMEIVLVDGGSTDHTAAIARRILDEGDIAWKIVDNACGTTPSNLNAGLAVAKGKFLCRVDARSLVPPAYVRLCVEVLSSRAEIAVVGGAQRAIAVNGSARSVGIARALNNRFAMGGSRYRSGAPSGPSDTVYLGAFRSDQLRDVGGWNDYFQTNQDYELNRRMARVGEVWFDDRLQVGYVPRGSVTALWRQYHRFGRWKARYWRQTGDRPQRRQVALLVGGLAGPLLLLAIARRRPWLGVLGPGIGFALEGYGYREVGSLPSRVVAVVALGAISTGWWSGVVVGVALRHKASAVSMHTPDQ